MAGMTDATAVQDRRMAASCAAAASRPDIRHGKVPAFERSVHAACASHCGVELFDQRRRLGCTTARVRVESRVNRRQASLPGRIAPSLPQPVCGLLDTPSPPNRQVDPDLYRVELRVRLQQH